tara:strand:- start:4394 stop:4771 length:378 start_codon:yes stop_codon:yes gene_type:complete
MSEEELVLEIRKVGYHIDSVYDLVNNTPHPFLERKFTGSYPLAYPILIKHLNKPYPPLIKEGIVRALAVKDASKVAKQPLLEEFYKDNNKFVKWAIANTLKCYMGKAERDKYPEIDQAFNNINAV